MGMNLDEYRQMQQAYRAARRQVRIDAAARYTPAQGRREALGLLCLVAACLLIAGLFGAFR